MSKLFVLVGVLLLFSSFVFAAVDFTPSGNINMRGRNITNVGSLCLSGDCVSSWTGLGGGGGGNASFNQTLTDSLYLLVNDQRYNNTAFAISLVNSVGNWSADKSSYNTITQANAKYIQNSTCAAGFVLQNATTGGVVCVRAENSSWNQSHANTLYYPLSSNPSGYLTSFSETDPLWAAQRGVYLNTTNGLWTGNVTRITNLETWNATAIARIAAVNTTANIQSLGFNTTTQLDSRYLQSYTETDPVWVASRPQYVNLTVLNNATICRTDGTNCPASGGLTLAQVAANVGNFTGNATTWTTCAPDEYSRWDGSKFSCYADAGAGGGMTSWVISNGSTTSNVVDGNRVNITGGTNVVVTQVGRDLTIAVPSTILSLSQVATNLGNWSLDKPSYATIAALAGAVGQNLTYALINTNMGNWSANRGVYLNTTNSLWTGNVTRISNLESANATTNASVTTLISTVNGQATAITNLQTANSTLNSSVVSLNTKVGNLETWNATAISRIASVNTTANVQSLGFNTTTQLDSRYLQSFTESDPVWNGVRSEYVNLTRLNNATICRTDGTNCPAASSLTLAQVAANVGNWTADRTAYINATTLDNATVCRSDGTNCPVGSSLTLAQVAANVGNWSNDKGSYLQNNSDVEFAKFNISGGNNITLGHYNYFWLNSTHTAPAYILGSVAGLRVLGGSLQVQSISLDSTLTGTAQAVIRVVNVSATNFNGTRMNLTEGVYASVGDFGSTNITASMVGALSTSENATICRTDGTNCPAGSSLTLAQVVANVGNWSLDKPSYATNAHVANVNTTANIVLLGFNTTVQLDSRYLQSYSETDPLWTAARGVYLNTTNSLWTENITRITNLETWNATAIARIASVGNWTNDRGVYLNTTNNLWTGNVTRITNLESANVTLNNKVNTLVNLTLAQVVANVGNWTLDKPSYALNTHVANVNATALKNSTVANFTRLYLTGNLSLTNSNAAGSIADNTTCTMIYSPNRNSRIEICN